MIFRRPAPELTNEAYARWLRAQRPPFELFLRLSALEQEAIANIGDNHVAEEAMALAYAINPGLVPQDGAAGPEVDSEASLARRLAEGLTAKLGSTERPQPRPVESMPRETLAGFGGRRVEQHNEPPRPTLFGRQPDPVAL